MIEETTLYFVAGIWTGKSIGLVLGALCTMYQIKRIAKEVSHTQVERWNR